MKQADRRNERYHRRLGGASCLLTSTLSAPGARSGRRDLLRTVAEGTAGAVGDEFLRCLVRHVALAFDAKFAFVAEAT